MHKGRKQKGLQFIEISLISWGHAQGISLSSAVNYS